MVSNVSRPISFRIKEEIIKKLRELVFEKYGTLYGTISKELENAIMLWYAIHKDFSLLKTILTRTKEKTKLHLINHNNMIIISSTKIEKLTFDQAKTRDLEAKIRELNSKIAEYKWAIKILNELFTFLLKNAQVRSLVREFVRKRTSDFQKLDRIIKEVSSR